MRILHTGDWHLGRTIEGRSRQSEQERFVDELCELVEQESVHMVLVAGDVFDGYNPPAAAEELYVDALARLADGGRRSVVVIAGNHDSPDRLCAVRALAHRHGISLFGYPQDDLTFGRAAGIQVGAGPGWVEIGLPNLDHSAIVLALPYPSESRLNEVLTQSLNEEDLQAAFSDRVGRLFQHVSNRYRRDTIRLAVSHLFVAGGQESPDSERPIQLGGAFTINPEALPAAAQYVALGHLHRAQQVRGASAFARYAGSPLAFSFSEVGQAKSVTLVDLTPDAAEPTVREIPLSSGRPLVRWVANDGLKQVEHWVEEDRDRQAWIDLEVHVTQPLAMADIQALRRMHEGFVNIRPVLPAQEVAAAREERQRLSLADQFGAFYRQKSAGALPPDEVVRLFLELATSEDEGGAEA